jgi:prevent-host-death family protein
MAKIKIGDLEPITATKAKVNFGDVLFQTSVEGKRYVVKSHGKPVAVVLSYNEYCRLTGEGQEMKIINIQLLITN